MSTWSRDFNLRHNSILSIRKGSGGTPNELQFLEIEEGKKESDSQDSGAEIDDIRLNKSFSESSDDEDQLQ